MPTIRAKIAEANADMRDVHHVTVYGHELTKDFTEIEVSDDVLAKLKGNATIDVQVRKDAAPEPAKPAAAKPAEPAKAE